ncbi:ImmA/IrrE family metallo-endopeptidase [Bifidobacterium adolescentis]|uniref:ImmA/IrrE family metallo-endopeptidase n=1 Tax=Bifidobacterium adolescentis TaxID=1680 RepID=UPI0040633C6E
MTEASGVAHDLLSRHAVTADHQLALPVDPAAVGRAEGIDVPSVGDAYGRWDSAVALGRALEPDGAEFGWLGDFAYALLMPAEIVRVMFASDLDVPEMARRFGVPWCQVRRRLAMLGLDDYCE